MVTDIPINLLHIQNTTLQTVWGESFIPFVLIPPQELSHIYERF